MPDIGDTRLRIFAGLTGFPTPADGATDVSTDLAEVSSFIEVQEWLGSGWFGGPGTTITLIGALSITMSGGISMNTPTGAILDYRATITSTSGESFVGETLYTWNFDNITLTHGTATFGSVIRSYSTSVVTFTTGAVVPILDTPADESTGIYLNKDHLLELAWNDAEGVPIARAPTAETVAPHRQAC